MYIYVHVCGITSDQYVFVQFPSYIMFILTHYIQYQATCIHLCTDAIGLFHITTEALSLADDTALESIVSHVSRSLRGLAGWSGGLPGL